MEYYTATKNEFLIDVFTRHCADQNKLDVKEYILYDLKK